ncbi:hypothetical protein HHI36_012393 [Cryptolaemus montrouzieri]|uniref:Uncharacterized protein n=1 Tax=Cryptolaemus montrouzieri TaxID=559131 RepID=A0ABD2NFK2_9CUCU
MKKTFSFHVISYCKNILYSIPTVLKTLKSIQQKIMEPASNLGLLLLPMSVLGNKIIMGMALNLLQLPRNLLKPAFLIRAPFRLTWWIIRLPFRLTRFLIKIPLTILFKVLQTPYTFPKFVIGLPFRGVRFIFRLVTLPDMDAELDIPAGCSDLTVNQILGYFGLLTILGLHQLTRIAYTLAKRFRTEVWPRIRPNIAMLAIDIGTSIISRGHDLFDTWFPSVSD